MKVYHSGLLFCLALSAFQSWAQVNISGGQVVSVPVSQTMVNPTLAVTQSGGTIYLNGSPTPAELEGNFSGLGEAIYAPQSGSYPPGPYPGNLIPADLLIPNGTFTSIGGTASVGANQTATVAGAGSAWNIGSALTVGATGTLSLTNGGAVNVGTISGSVSNAGTVSIYNGTSLNISQNLLYAGNSYVQTAGLTTVDGTLNGSVDILGGQFGGSGTVNGYFINNATLAPGDPQTLTINGNFWQFAPGQLVIDITGANSFDILDVKGNVTLGGDVIFNFLNGYVPTANTQFSFLQTTGTVSGSFAAIDIAGLNCPTCTFNSSTLSFDTGNTAPTSAVPEPSAMALLAAGVIAFAAATMRRQRFR